MPLFKEIAPLVADRVDQQFQSEKTGILDVVSTGIDAIDAAILGLRKGDVSILAGKPGVGKSTFALQIAAIVSGYQSGLGALYVTWRESAVQVGMRVAAYGAGQKTVALLRGQLDDDGWAGFAESLTRFSESDLIVESVSPEFETLRYMLQGAPGLTRSPICLVVVEDFWGYCDSTSSAINFLKWLKQYAMKHQVAVLLTGASSQLSADDPVWGWAADFSDLTLELVSETLAGSNTLSLFVRKQHTGPPALVSLRFDESNLYY